MGTRQKLQALREAMGMQKLIGYLQPVHDEYMNEYPPDAFRRVEWLCGFSGSAGTVVVMQDKAAFFTDGRYTLQAEAEVDSALFERYNIADLLPEAWIAQHAGKGSGIGYDPKLHGRDAVKRMQAALDKVGAMLVPVTNLVDAIWEGRPVPPSSPLFVHELKYAGASSADKRKRIGQRIKEAGADAAVITAPDAVNWLLNIRASDIEGAPLALATAIVLADGRAQLFVAPERCNEAVREHLGYDVIIAEPQSLEDELKKLSRTRVLCDAKTAPVWFTQVLEGAGAKVISGEDPVLLPKAMKNAVELQGMRDAHIRDGAAVAKLLCWLDNTKDTLTELAIGDKLLAFRAESPLFKGPSFNTIAGSGPHGAIVHYRATEKSNRTLTENEIFLLDSGGQYPDGTTDITRTVAIGMPTAEQKDRFTRVLKGHIAIATATFPEGTPGSDLDKLAREPLWQVGLDYDHGTGHGVGHFLNVHEGPQRISKRTGDAPLQPGMIISNEPGYYKSGEYGIRIENLVAVEARANQGERKRYFGFETITCAPIDTRLIDKGLMTPAEKSWLNQYHQWVQANLSPLMDARGQRWLAERCAPV